MKALLQYGGRDMRLEDVPEPEPGLNEVKIKVKWCGICGSDVHEYQGMGGLLPLKKPHPGTGKTIPVIGDHEFSGEVVKVGNGVNGINPGDRVTVKVILPCYKCYYCKKGMFLYCDLIGAIGSAADGAFAEYIVVPSKNVYVLPESVSYEMGAFTEPLTCALRGVRRSRLKAGSTISIIGAGPIGLLTMQVAIAYGAEKIIVFEELQNRINLAKELGATEVVNPEEVNPERTIAELTEGRRADIVFECAGPCEAMLLAEKVCARGGKIVELGVMINPCLFSFSSLHMREKMIITSNSCDEEYGEALSLLADGKVSCDPILISSMISLDDIIEKGFEELSGERRSEHCKILVSPKL